MVDVFLKAHKYQDSSKNHQNQDPSFKTDIGFGDFSGRKENKVIIKTAVH